MARPFPWLWRLPNIRRAVSNSQRSHYGRRDLQGLFVVSSSAASRLLELISTEPVGTSHLVSREKLSSFLEAVAETDDVPALCARLRAERGNLTRVKARFMWLRDDSETPLISLPAAIALEPGRLEIRFERVEELVAHLGLLSAAMKDDPEAFERASEIRRPEYESPDARFLRMLEAEKVWIAEELERRKDTAYVPRPIEDFEREWELAMQKRPPLVEGRHLAESSLLQG